MIELNAELLLGRKVRDADGKNIGRIEEFDVERADSACLVKAYLVGTSALIDRLSAWSLIRPIRKSLRGRGVTFYHVPWDQMDLSDPENPTLKIPGRELRHAK